MSRGETERIRQQLRARPHVAGECIDERVGLMQEVERLRGELDDTTAHLAGLLRQSLSHQSDRDALKERKNVRIRGLSAEVERLTAENERLRKCLGLRADSTPLPVGEVEVMRGFGWLRTEREWQLTAERDEARDAAEHLWSHGQEHSISHQEANRWYPWLYELHEQKQAARRQDQP